ncbi:alpha/beta fold hydrolase [Candidatus Woesearchaeota archaeon]|nr:alpha/beta fold hydrolase [Candidatus Woesearchaeota archaeon]
MNRISIGILIFALIIFAAGFEMYQTTGFLQKDDIDKLDVKNWDLANGLIPGSQAIEFSGTSGTCWVLVHGYTSTPDELRDLAIEIFLRFNDSVYVPRLYGHGERPSHLEQYSVEEWYHQVEQVADEKQCTYILGSSMGASIALRYAEKHHVDGVVLLGMTVKPQPGFLPINEMIQTFHSVLRYTKKTEPGETVMLPEGKKAHLSYWTFPLKGAAELVDFNKEVMNNIETIKTPVLFLHASQDTVALPDAAKNLYDELQTKKQFILLDEGNHIILRDYAREEAIAHVLDFREQISQNGPN